MDLDNLSLTAVSELALRSGSWTTSNSLAPGQLLLGLGDVVEVLGVDGLVGVLLGLCGGATLDWTRLASDLHLGMRNIRDGLAVKNSCVGLLSGFSSICILCFVLAL